MTLTARSFFEYILSILLILVLEPLCAQTPDTLVARDLMNKAQKHFEQRQHKELIASGERAIKIYEDLLGPGHVKTAHAYKLVGKGYSFAGQMDKAIDFLKKSLNIFINSANAGDNQEVIADIYTNLAFSEWFAGKFDHLGTYYLKAAEIYKTIYGQDGLKVADQYYNLGIYKKTVGLNNEALKYYQKAADIYARSADPFHPRLAAIYNNWGNIYSRFNDWDNQLLYYNKCLEITLKNRGEDHFETGIIYNNIGTVWRKKGHYDKARYYFKKVVNMSDGGDLKQITSKAGALDNIGNSYQFSKQYDSALYYHQRAYKWYLEIYDENHPELAQSFRYQGNVYTDTKQYDLAKSAYDKATKILKQRLGPKHRSLFSLYYDYATYFTATKQYDSALYYNNRVYQFSLGQDNDQKINYDSVQSPMLWLQALNQKGRLHASLYEIDSNSDNLDKALNAYNVAIDYTDFLRANFHEDDSRLILSQQSYDTYENSINLLMTLFDLYGDDTYLHQVFSLIEKSKSINLLTSLNKTKIQQYAGVPTELLEKEQFLVSQIGFNQNLLLKETSKKSDRNPDKINEYRHHIIASKEAYYQLLENYKFNYPAYFSIKFSTSHITSTEVQSLLDSDQGLLNYFFGQQHIYVAVVTHDDVSVKILDREAINDKIEQLRQGITQRDLKAFGIHAYELYEDLLAPAMDENISDKKSLIIIPDGNLGAVPFDILLTEDPGSTDYKDLKYVLKDFNIRYLHAATLLERTPGLKRTSKSDELLAFAPVFGRGSPITTTRDGRELGQIPYAQEEIENIKKVIDATTFSGAAATESQLKSLISKGKYNMLHFATHAVVDNESPNFTRLLFADEEDSIHDGRLHAYELYNMKIDADLVTLSACNTGIGTFYKGEGTMSLARAFAYAGCPSIVMSLWPAQDKSTSNLMQKFYKNINAGQHTDEALRNAKLAFLADADKFTANPYYWAGFVVLGNNQPVVHKFSLWGTAMALLVFFLFAYLVLKFGVNRNTKL